MLVHVDTDLGDNPDDACALAMLLAWPEVEVMTVTTVGEQADAKVGHVREVLRLSGAADVRVERGGRAAVAALGASLASGAAVIALGPLTNLADLERRTPGSLGGARLTVSGGWLDDPGPGLPAWSPQRDSNVTADPDAARIVWATTSSAGTTWVPITASASAALNEDAVRELADSGPLGRRLAELSLEHAARRGYRPPLVNYLFDPVAAAVAVGWPGAQVAVAPVELVETRGPVQAARPEAAGWRFVRSSRPGARSTRVVTHVDGNPFDPTMLR